MQFTKNLLIIAAFATCVLAATPLTDAVTKVASSEAKVKDATLKLSKDRETFATLGTATAKLSDDLKTATATYKKVKKAASEPRSQKILQKASDIASDVHAATRKLVKIAPKLKRAKVNDEFSEGLVGLGKEFSSFGDALAAKVSSSSQAQARSVFKQISSDFSAAIEALK